MSNYTTDLNSLIDTKREIKNIIIDTLDENPSEVFSYYPSYLRTIAAGYGSGSMDEDEVNAYISAYLSAYNFIDQDALSANSYVTSTALENASYVTEQALNNASYITAADIPEVDLSSYVTYDFLSSQSYISSIPSEYITQDELSANSYLTQHQDLSSYVSKIELNGMSYATQSYVMDKIGAIPASPDLSSYVTYDYLSNQSYISSIPSEYITQDELSANSYLTQHQDLSSYLLSPTISGYTGQMKLYNDGFLEVTSQGNVRAKTFTYNQLNSWNAYTLINRDSLKNYVNGRLSDIESTYATTSYVADYVATYASGGSGNYLPLTGGEVTGPLYVSYQQTNNALYGFKSYSHIVAGDEEKTTPAFLASKRYCTNGIGSYINMASFFVNSDGRAKFAHKASGGGGGDDAFMCFNAYGFKIAYSGEAGVSASTEYDLIHSGNIGDYAGVTNENIIPKETNTYTLGDSSYFYSNSYVSDMWLGTKNKFSNRSDNQVNLMLNNGWKYTFHNNGFSGASSGMDLGNVTPWRSTYSYNYYTAGHQIYGDEYALDFKINGNTTARLFTSSFRPWTNKGISLGASDNMFKTTYTSYLYADINGVSTDIGYYLSYNLAGIETLLANI